MPGLSWAKEVGHQATASRACLLQRQLAILADYVLPECRRPRHCDSQGAEGRQIQPIDAQRAYVLQNTFFDSADDHMQSRAGMPNVHNQSGLLIAWTLIYSILFRMIIDDSGAYWSICMPFLADNCSGHLIVQTAVDYIGMHCPLFLLQKAKRKLL